MGDGIMLVEMLEEVLHLLTLLGSTRATGRFIYFETLIMKQATGRSDIEEGFPYAVDDTLCSTRSMMRSMVSSIMQQDQPIRASELRRREHLLGKFRYLTSQSGMSLRVS